MVPPKKQDETLVKGSSRRRISQESTVDPFADESVEAVQGDTVDSLPGPEITNESLSSLPSLPSTNLENLTMDQEFQEAEGSFLVVEEPRRESVRNLIGKRIGDYEVEAVLGRGGMGVVYLAKSLKLDRYVALKMILSGGHASDEHVKRFVNEARAIAHLQHPNIVQVFEIDQHDGLPYFSLEYVDGESLSERFKDRSPSPKQAAEMIVTLAEAMQYAHENGVIHRDLKPGNVLVSSKGVLKITDFGLAKQVEKDDGQTKMGTVLGTPGYMPPEQAKGQANTLAPNADQYSLGALLYRLLCGRAPFVSSRTMDTLMQVIESEPVPPQRLSPDVPVDLETICLKTLSKDPAGRYEDCQALADDLKRYINGEPILARPISKPEQLYRWCRRNPKIAGLVTTTFALLVALAGIMSWSSFAIAKERDRAKDQEMIAKENMQVAIINEEKAKAKEAIAREQASRIVKTMQGVLVQIDTPLSRDPSFAKTRLEIMKSLSSAYHDLEIDLHTEVRSDAIPTFMAMRFKMVGVFESLNESDLALEEVKRVYELGKERIKVKEGSDASRMNLVNICLSYAQLLQKVEGAESAKSVLNEAITVARDIVANRKVHPDNKTPTPEFTLRFILSNAITSSAVHHYKNGELDEAAPLFDEAAKIRKSLLETLPEEKEFKEFSVAKQKAYLGEVKLNYHRSLLAGATIALKTGRHEEAFEKFDELIALSRKSFEEDPTVGNESELGKLMGNVAFNHFKVDNVEKAKELLEEAVAISAKFAERNPDDFQSQYTHSVELYRLGCVQEQLGVDAAQSNFGKCVAIRKKLYDATPDLKNEGMLMVALARSGKFEEAVKMADKLSADQELEVFTQTVVARAYTQASRFVEDVAQKSLIRDKGVLALRKAIAKGYEDHFQMKTEPDYDPIESLDEFQELLASIK